MKTTDFNHFSELLQRAGSATSGSEAHGLLCGLLCMGGREALDIWISNLIPDDGSVSNSAVAGITTIARSLYADTVSQINDSLLEFSLFLPDDEEVLHLRTDALAKWCQGFIYGLGLCGSQEDDSHKGDVVELIYDFSEIAKADCLEDEANEEQEAAFTEVEEYVRISVSY